MKPQIQIHPVSIPPFAPPAKPGHPKVLLTGNALIGIANRTQLDTVNRWREMHRLPTLAGI